MTRDERNSNWGRLLKFSDPDGNEHTWAMPQSLLAGTNSEYESFLRDQGVQVFNRKLLSTYLAGKSDKRVLVVARTGWHKAAFVFPDGCVGSNDGDQVFHQSDAGANHLMTTAGTLEDWQQNVSRLCSGNSRLLLAVSAGFASTLLAKVGVEGGGFHFRGDTSKGKTTLLLIAGSVWGGGSDNGFIRRWRATINGLESVAASHNDALLCLDELAEVDPREAGETAYMLANGQGKIRQTKNITLRKQLEWRTLFLSSGEISLADHLSQAGKKTRGGMEVRLLDLPCDPGAGFGVFENLHHFDSPKEMADHLRHAARQYYGVAIRQFIETLTKQPETEIKQAWDTVRRSFHKDHCPKDSSEEVGRACDRFALVGFAGEAATEAGITGWNEGEAINTAATMFRAWLDGRGVGSTTEAAAIQQVDLFLEQHGDSRFRRLGGAGRSEDQRTIQNQAGYRESFTNDEGEETTIYYITPEFFRSEVCKGFNVVSVAKWLLSRKRLRTTHDLRCEKRTPDGKKKMYAITETSTE